MSESPKDFTYESIAFGVKFKGPVGLAAGFDKDAEILEALPLLGFGFAEIGTVTPRPQAGNEKPRLFRDPDKETIFNRMGFNSAGANVVSERLRMARARLPETFRVGVNLGKNKDTPLEKAAEDYSEAAKAFEGLADYLVINVSSPNTPGLRSLQTMEALRPICEAVNRVVDSWKKRPPVLLKLAPEVDAETLKEIFGAASQLKINGWVLTNTLGGTRHEKKKGEPLAGGWSGRVLTEISRNKLKEAKALTSLPIISVGGIMDPQEAKARLRAGANLVQIYSGWIFRGPTFPSEIVRELYTG